MNSPIERPGATKPLRLRISRNVLWEVELTLVDDEPLGDITQLIESIRVHGLFEPITVTADGDLLNGYRRYMALQELGVSEFESVHLRITTKEAAAILPILRPQRAARMSGLS